MFAAILHLLSSLDHPVEATAPPLNTEGDNETGNSNSNSSRTIGFTYPSQSHRAWRGPVSLGSRPRTPWRVR
jgi:hypothetical protein